MAARHWNFDTPRTATSLYRYAGGLLVFLLIGTQARLLAATTKLSGKDNGSSRKTTFPGGSTGMQGNLAEYKLEINRKMQLAENLEEFMRVLFPAEPIMARWIKMVNESAHSALHPSARTDLMSLSDMANLSFEEVYDHGMRIKCGKPQNALIDMYDELNVMRGGDTYLYPGCTTVMRCQRSGCCNENATCVGKAETRQNISLPFTVVKILSWNPSDYPEQELRLIRHTLYADTECVCKNTTGPSQYCYQKNCPVGLRFDSFKGKCVCLKSCPAPYIQDQVSCECICDGKHCNKIKRGKRRMDEEQCRCVNDGSCHRPGCKRGYVFDDHDQCTCVRLPDSNGKPPRGRGKSNHSPPGTMQSDNKWKSVPKRRGRMNFFSSESVESLLPAVGFSQIDPGSGDEDEAYPWEWTGESTGGSDLLPDCGSQCQIDDGAEGGDSGSGTGGK